LCEYCEPIGGGDPEFEFQNDKPISSIIDDMAKTGSNTMRAIAIPVHRGMDHV
jgi:hypothetical protein